MKNSLHIVKYVSLNIMKKCILFLILIAYSLSSFAQQGINYKALIKDGSGNVVANSFVFVQFTIYQGAGESNMVYQETHTPNTDANGMVMLNVGEGTTSDNFSGIDWDADDHYLNTQINIGTGLTDLGTTAFKTVPYAILSEKVIQENDPKVGILTDNIIPKWSGSTLLDSSIFDDGNNIGIGTTTPGTVVPNSKLDVVGGHISVSNDFGVLSYNAAADSFGAGFDTSSTDDLHLIAGGSNKLTVSNDGSISATDFSIAEINATGNTALITKEFADANYFFSGDYNDLTNLPTITNPTGLERITENGKSGYRLTNRNPAYHADIGTEAVDLSFADYAGGSFGATGNYSIALGYRTIASGGYSLAFRGTASADSSIALGYSALASGPSCAALTPFAKATGDTSTALGFYATASGLKSISIGEYTTASGTNAIAMGLQSTAAGNSAVAIGNNLVNNVYNSFVIGRHNVGVPYAPGTADLWFPQQPVFEIGIGHINENINAMTVLKNGNVGIGTATPIYPLHVTTRNDFVGDPTPNHYLSNNGVGLNGTGWTYSIGATYGVWSGVGFATSSDSRIKNIIGQSNTTDDLSKLMKLEITDYQYIDVVNKGNKVTKKVIAQQVKEVLPNAVNYTVDFIPNIYQLVTISKTKEGQTRLMFKEDSGVSENDILKFITENNAEVTARVISVLGNTVIVDSELKGKDNQIFVFGKRVNDFHTVDYDAISMLNVSATQEQQKLIETLQEKVQSLQKQNNALQAEANKILALEKDMLELKTMLLTKKEQTKITQN